MNKIYRSKHGMLAIVRPDGTAVWLHSLEPVLKKPDLEEWEEMLAIPVADFHDIETVLVGSLRVGNLVLDQRGFHIDEAPEQ